MTSWPHHTILTDREALHISNEFIPHSYYVPGTIYDFPTNDAIMMNDTWFQQGLRNLFWLPHEYRGNSTAFYGNMLAIGRHSGQIAFLQLDHP